MSARGKSGAPRRRHDALPSDVPHLSDPVEMDAVIRQVAQTRQAYRVPYLIRARNGDLAFSMPEKGKPVPASFLELQRPRLVILTDAGPGATGPGGWSQAAALLGWAKAAVFYAAAGDPHQYAMIAKGTVLRGRLLLVEMQQQHMQAWERLAEPELPRLELYSIEGVPAGTVIH